MRSNEFTAVWEALSPDLRRTLLRHPARPLRPEQVDELASAGGRVMHALWFDDRPGRPRQWATTWQFRRFVEHYRDTETVDRPANRRQPDSGARGRRLPMTPG
jgi:hypothetical protein